MAFDFNELIAGLRSNQQQAPQQTAQGQFGFGQDPNIFGGNNSFLQSLLRQQTSGENPAIAQQRSAALNNIGRSTDRGIRNINEGQAASGFRGGGANLFNDLFSGQSNAIGNMDANFAQQQTAYNQSGINNLLGLNQFQGGQTMGNNQMLQQNNQFGRSLAFDQEQLAEQRRQFDEQNSTGFWDVVGGVLGTGVGAFTGGLGANLFGGGGASGGR